MASFDLSNLETLPAGYSLMDVEEEQEEEETPFQSSDPIGASLDVALLPAGFGTQSQNNRAERSLTFNLDPSGSTTRQVARSNLSRVDGIDEISPRMLSLYELYKTFSGAARKGNHGFFVQTGGTRVGQAATEQNDSILEQVRLYGNLQERTAAFVAGLQEVEDQASSSNRSSTIQTLNSMTREEVIKGLQDGTITFDATAEHALQKAAVSTQMQFRKRFPSAMNYPSALEAWMLAMGRTPITRLPFIDIAFAFYNETGMQDFSISKSSTSLDANLAPVAGAARDLITDPVKSQVFENLGAVTGEPYRIRKPKPLLLDLF